MPLNEIPSFYASKTRRDNGAWKRSRQSGDIQLPDVEQDDHDCYKRLKAARVKLSVCLAWFEYLFGTAENEPKESIPMPLTKQGMMRYILEKDPENTEMKKIAAQSMFSRQKVADALNEDETAAHYDSTGIEQSDNY